MNNRLLTRVFFGVFVWGIAWIQILEGHADPVRIDEPIRDKNAFFELVDNAQIAVIVKMTDEGRYEVRRSLVGDLKQHPWIHDAVVKNPPKHMLGRNFLVMASGEGLGQIQTWEFRKKSIYVGIGVKISHNELVARYGQGHR